MTFRCAPHELPWPERLATMPVPILRASRLAVDHWRERSDRADASLLADLALADPLLCTAVLASAARRLGGRLATPVETVTGALVLTGIDAFFDDTAALPVLEARLEDDGPALGKTLALVARSHSAARLAAAIGIQRQDEHVELLHQAALLHGCVALLLWYDAPHLSMEMAHRQAADPALRSAAVQRELFGLDFDAITHALWERWQLPPSVRELQHGGDEGSRTVALAVRIARHLDTPEGWHNAAMPDDLAELGLHVHLPAGAAASLVRRALG